MSSKILLYFVFMITASTSFSQATKGMKFIGGSFGFSSQKASSSQLANSQKESGLYVAPTIGWFLKENLVGGVEFFSNSSKSEAGSPATSTNRHSFGLGVFGRSYQNIGKGFYLFAHHNISYSSDRYEYNVAGSNQSKSSGFSIQTSLYPGISYAVRKKLQIETSLGNLFYAGYSHSNNPGNTQNSDLKINRFAAGINANAFSSLSFGLRFFLD